MFSPIKRRIRSIRRHISPFAPIQDNFRRALKGLGRGKVAIDCGANIGAYTVILARTGAEVHAFEPNPHAFGELSKRVKRYSNVFLYNKAVSSHDGRANLFFHKEVAEDPIYHSTSASLEKNKSNIDDNNYAEVEIIDFGNFVEKIGRVDLLKMDIEGHEIEVLNCLIDRGLIENIGSAFIELHDRDHPALKFETDKLRSKMTKVGIHFDLDWH